MSALLVATPAGDTRRGDRPPGRIELVEIGPEYAQELFDNRAPNRGISKNRVRQHTRAILQKRWRFLGDPIRIDWHNRLSDGQHRMLAVIESGMTVTFLVMFDCDPDDQVAYDNVRQRSAADEFQRMQLPNSTLRAAIIRAVIQWDHDSVGSMRYAPDNDEIVAFQKDHPDGIDDALATVAKVKLWVPLMQSIVGAVQYKTAQENPVLSDRFFNEWIFPDEHREANPVLALIRIAKRRAAMGNGREDLESMDRLATLYYITKAWDAYRSGKSIQKLQAPKSRIRMDHIPHVGPAEEEPEVAEFDETLGPLKGLAAANDRHRKEGDQTDETEDDAEAELVDA